MNKFYIMLLACTMLLFACEENGIDAITPVDPGPDLEAPEVNLVFPVEGSKIQVAEDVTSLRIQFEVTDDIEVESIRLMLDGSEIASYANFPDYRRVLEEFTYDLLTNGDHTLQVIATDLVGQTTTVSVDFEKVEPYQPMFDGEIFYMPFDNNYLELLTLMEADRIGNPSFAGTSVVSGSGLNSYEGAADSYLTFPTDAFLDDNQPEFSTTFWYKLNASPDRAGVLVIGPPDTANPTSANNRTKGFRFFRENAGGMQRFKLNIGRGTADSWFDGGAAADVDPSVDQWVHFAFTISNNEARVFINDQIVREGSFDGISWEDCDKVSIMSGAPNFIGWNHRSDQSIMDELRFYDKALSPAEVMEIMDATS